MKEIEVQYLDKENLITPTQGYEEDFAYDVYAAEGRLVPPLSFKSTLIPTNLHTSFDPTEVGMHIALRSGVAFRTPLLMSNAPGIIEGNYRGNICILVRNSFIDNSMVDFVITPDGSKLELKEVPEEVKENAREFFEDELDSLGYGSPEGNPVFDNIFKTKVPRGTVYVAQGERIAQMYFAPKISAKFVQAEVLPESTRGDKGKGSSGTKNK